MSEWQPIESAPVNKSILIFLPNWDHYGHGVYRAILVDMGTGKRWLTTGWASGRDLTDGLVPTHWMPLPDPPNVADVRCSCGKELTATLSGDVLVVEPCQDCLKLEAV